MSSTGEAPLWPIEEYIIQPRTGSQCPQPGHVCQNTKQFSWSPHGSAQQVTLGYVGKTDKISSEADSYCKTLVSDDNTKIWSWGNLGGSTTLCIQPVEQLCYMDSIVWDGVNYDPTTWKDGPLKDTFVSAEFVTDCLQSNKNIQAGGETPMTAAMCPVKCTYDASKFTTLDQINAYELKYNKYPDDTSICFTSPAYNDNEASIKSCLSKTTGNSFPNQSNAKPFTQQYDDIMTHFCAQPTTHCRTDPSTGLPANKCSFLMSAGPEGDKCRAWLATHGPYKFNIMNYIGKYYCSANEDAYDCRCYNRKDDKTFQDITKQIQSVGGGFVPPGCYYTPCADSTNYIIDTDVFKPPSTSSSYSDPGYGFFCADTICATIVQSGANTTMSGNSEYVQCTTNGGQSGGNTTYYDDDEGKGKGGKHSSGESSKGSDKDGDGINLTLFGKPVSPMMFSLYIALIAIGCIIVLGIIVGVVKYAMWSTPNDVTPYEIPLGDLRSRPFDVAAAPSPPSPTDVAAAPSSPSPTDVAATPSPPSPAEVTSPTDVAAAPSPPSPAEVAAAGGAV